MENCDVKFGDACRTLATRNVTAKAIVALFGLHATASIWLKDMTDTYVFPDENGLFPVLEPFATYHVEVGPSRDQESRTGKRVKRLNNYLSLSEESSDDDLQRSAYRLSVASAGKSASKKKLKDQKSFCNMYRLSCSMVFQGNGWAVERQENYSSSERTHSLRRWH